jgi:hypothetical protein
MGHGYLRLRDDGDYDVVDVDDDGNETVSETITEDQKNDPYHRIDDDQAAMINRSLRTAYLEQTDWWEHTNITEAQRAYRQALRDITDHANWPRLLDADWPTKP